MNEADYAEIHMNLLIKNRKLIWTFPKKSHIDLTEIFIKIRDKMACMCDE
jgi:hypothetical protein